MDLLGIKAHQESLETHEKYFEINTSKAKGKYRSILTLGGCFRTYSPDGSTTSPLSYKMYKADTISSSVTRIIPSANSLQYRYVFSPEIKYVYG